MADIFLSHASEDCDRLRPLVETFEAEGWTVWWDDRDLHAGPRFDVAIEEAIRAAACVVVAWSEHAVRSAWVRDEASEGQEREILVPLRLDDVRPPLGFRSAQTASLAEWPGQRGELDMLLEGIRVLMASTRPSDTETQQATSHPSAPKSEIPSIAVLRFTDMSDGRDQAALCEGISDELINELGQMSGLKVIARTSSFLFDSNSTSIREIGHRLGVENVLEGSIRIAGDQIRITAQLIECPSEFHCWSKSYTRDLSDIFALYDDITSEIGRELEVIMRSEELQRTALPPTGSVGAWNLLMQAQFKYKESARPNDAFPLVEQALELDPEYAEAHSFKSLLYWAQVGLGHVAPEEGFSAARKAAERALEIDPKLVPAHMMLGEVRLHLDLDFRLAAESFREAERLGALPHGHLLLSMGRYEDALEVYRQDEQLNPAGAMEKVFVATALDRLRRTEEASAKYEEALDLGPRNNFVLNNVLNHYIRTARDFARANRVLEEYNVPHQMRNWAKAAISLEQGNTTSMRALVEQWVRNRDTEYLSAGRIANVFYLLGDYEEHIRWFAVRERERDTLNAVPDFLRQNPDYWDNLREWSLSEPDRIRERLEMIDEHRAHIDRITEKMVL